MIANSCRSSDKIEGESSSSQPAAKPHKAPDTLEMDWEDSSAEHTIPGARASEGRGMVQYTRKSTLRLI